MFATLRPSVARYLFQLSNNLIYPPNMHPDIFSLGSDPSANSVLPSLKGLQQDDASDTHRETSHGECVAGLLGQNNELLAEVERLKSERNRLLETEHRIMDLLGAKAADKIIHDLRNVLNERDLLRVLTSEI